MRTIQRILAAAALAAGTVVAVPSTSHAYVVSECLDFPYMVGQRTWKDSAGQAMANVAIYGKRNASADPGSICAYFAARGAYEGVAKYMGITLCDNWVDTPCDSDTGTFKYYAGPVYQKDGACGYATVRMRNAAGTTIINDSYYLVCD
ncbi:hypothetical protein [Streptomyces sp. NPDC102462]|uniref:hypothetical protein n=1 Tax=Streptomyces sp. NPDC102462 TaxID=3366178 RepID=UPI0037FAF76F